MVSWHLKGTAWLRRVRRRVLRARIIVEVFYMVFAGIGPGERGVRYGRAAWVRGEGSQASAPA